MDKSSIDIGFQWWNFQPALTAFLEKIHGWLFFLGGSTNWMGNSLFLPRELVVKTQ